MKRTLRWRCTIAIKLISLNQFKKEFNSHPYGHSSLAYGTGSVGCVLLEERDDLGLLGWGTPTADHGWTLACQLNKFMLVITQTHLQNSIQPDAICKTRKEIPEVFMF